jgi:hypothetical protein
MELLFKEWKSSANLHAFDTENEHITEAVIWASLAASSLKRFLAHAAEHLLEVVISTRKAAMWPAYVLSELLHSLRYGGWVVVSSSLCSHDSIPGEECHASSSQA